MVNAFALARVHPWHMLCVRHTQVRPAAGIIGPQNRVAITLQYMGPGPKVDANLELSDSQPYWWSDIPNDACLELVITMASSPLATYRHHVVCVKKSTLTKSQSQVWFSLFICLFAIVLVHLPPTCVFLQSGWCGYVLWESTLQHASQCNSSRLCLTVKIVLLFVHILMFGAVKPMQRR
jgi:hypothetical protein